MLQRAYANGLHPASLRRDLKHFLRQKPESTFSDTVQEAQRWMREERDPDATVEQTAVANPGVVKQLEAEVATLRAEMASLREQMRQCLAAGHQTHPPGPPLHIQSCEAVKRDPVPDPPDCHWCARLGHTENQCRSKRAYLKRSRQRQRRRQPEAVTTKVTPLIINQTSVTHSSRKPTSPPVPKKRQDKSFLPQLSPGELRRLQREDRNIGPNLNSWPAKPSGDQDWQLTMLVKQHGRLLCRKGVLYRRVTDPKQGLSEQLVLPSSLRSKVLTSLHRHLGHRGHQQAAEMLRPHAYWPGMYLELENYLATCQWCRKIDHSSKVPTLPACTPQPDSLNAASVSDDSPDNAAHARMQHVTPPIPVPIGRRWWQTRQKPHQQSRLEDAGHVPVPRPRLQTSHGTEVPVQELAFVPSAQPSA
ncbi:hypothetical protein ACOMHN_049697 [Nucella lapillus]